MGDRIDVFDIGSDGLTEDAWRAWLADVDPPAWKFDPTGTLVLVAPHPDDEVFALGGLIHDIALAGGRTIVVAVTDGEAAYGSSSPSARARLVRRRSNERLDAFAQLGAGIDVVRPCLPDGGVAGDEDRLAAVLTEVAEGASWVLAPWIHDGHPDHDATGRAAARAAHAAGVPLGEYLVWAWQWARPSDLPAHRLRQWRLSDGAQRAKAAAVAAFPSQTRPSPDGRPVVPASLLTRFTRDHEVVLV